MGARYADFLGLDTASSLANNQVKAADQIVSDSGALKGKYMELMERYGNAINVNHSLAAQQAFQGLESRYGAQLRALGNASVTAIVDKMSSGAQISYAEVQTLKDVIQNNQAWKDNVSVQQFARELDTQNETMKGITAEFMLESMAGTADYMTGSDPRMQVFTRGTGNFDKDLEVKITTEEQHIAENAAALSGVMGANGPDDLITAFHTDFKKFEGGAKAKGNKARETLSSDKEALARESTQRRKANNEKK